MASSFSPSRFAIVGAGRVGGSLGRGLRAAGHTVRLYPHGAQPDRWFFTAEAIFLTVPDGAIADAAREWCSALEQDPVVAHCSGALGLEPLAEARTTHRGSLHPLFAIPSPRTSLRTAPAAIDGDPVSQRLLTRWAQELGMRPFQVPSENRVLYHAAAVIASSGLVAAAAAATEVFSRLGVSRDQALDTLLPLIGSALEGLRSQGLPGAITGPLARDDRETIRRQMLVLNRRGLRTELALYRALCAQLRALRPNQVVR